MMPEESHHIIKIQELRLIWLPLQCWTFLLEGISIRILSNNAMTVAYIHQEATRSLAVARSVQDSVLRTSSHFSLVHHLHSRRRQLADRLPHLAAPRLGGMVPTLSDALEPMLQMGTPDVDLQDRTVPKCRDPMVEVVDALVAH